MKVRCQWLDAFTPPMEEHIGKLVNVVCRYLGKEPVISPKSKESNEVSEQPKAPGKKIPIPKEMPEDVKKIAEKIGVQKVIKNDKGLWEADYGNKIKMVYIPDGEFKMGSSDYDNEKPIHAVYLDGYWMGKTVVTVGQFKRFVEDKGYKTDAEKNGGAYSWTGEDWEMKKDINWKNPGFEQDDNHPVVCVSWNDAVEYCKWISEKREINFKLPTEAQWEKAARGSDGRKYPWGNNEPDKTLANFDVKIGKTSPVDSYPNGSSPYGLLDMTGNVWEWCNDWYGNDYYKNSPKDNPTGPKSGSDRVVRGGGWVGDAGDLRCAFRGSGGPSIRDDGLGFRLCQDN